MAPDPPSRAQGCQTRSQVKAGEINNEPQGFPGAPVHQVFAVFIFKQPKVQHTPPTATKTQNIREKGDHQKVGKREKLSVHNPTAQQKTESLVVQNAGTTSLVENEHNQL